jgi:hypothetical protein
MIPQGVPAKSCSAFWHRNAFFTPSILSILYNFSKNVAVATSNAADEDKPLPSGTLDTTTMLTAALGGKSLKYCAIVPLT